MTANRQRAMTAGALFILAAVTAIIGLALYGPVLHDANYILDGSANNTQVIWGAFLEIVLAFSVVGIGITMFPVLKLTSESLAIGYVCFRLLEATIIIIGVMSLLSILTLGHEPGGAAVANAPSYLVAGKLLVALHDWTFLFGPNVALGPSTLMMSYILYRSRLVPRPIALLGLVGGPLIVMTAMFVMFGLYPQISMWGIIFAIPIFAYEMSLAVWLVAKGFNPTAIEP